MSVVSHWEKLVSKNIHHAWLVHGAHAQEFANFLLGSNIQNHPDFLELNPDPNYITIDQVRACEQFIFATRHSANSKVVLINGAEQMTVAACNAILKSLEEPPEHVYFILSTKNYLRLLPTIVSRCQKLFTSSFPRSRESSISKDQSNLLTFFITKDFLINFDKLAQYNKKTELWSEILETLTRYLKEALYLKLLGVNHRHCEEAIGRRGNPEDNIIINFSNNIALDKLLEIINFLSAESEFLQINNINPQIFLEAFFISMHSYS